LSHRERGDHLIGRVRDAADIERAANQAELRIPQRLAAVCKKSALETPGRGPGNVSLTGEASLQRPTQAITNAGIWPDLQDLS
jgi:hypothetical protein